ncbi:MAG: DUF4870 domain-containing protein [Gammaproteobacteria bacterium]
MTLEQQSLPPLSPPINTNKPNQIWAMLCHLSSLAGFLVPFGNIVVPLIIWAVKKNDDPLIDAAGKESINFQLTMIIFFVIAAVLLLVLIGFLLLPLLVLYDVVLVVIASIDSYHGKSFRYPFTIRFLQ